MQGREIRKHACEEERVVSDRGLAVRKDSK